MKTYRVHPLATLFPPIIGEEFEALASDIETNGLRESITTLDGEILDGRNRLRACEDRGVEPRFEEWTPAGDGDTPEKFVIARNLYRRHLADSQRAVIAAKLVNHPGRGAKGFPRRQKGGGDSGDGFVTKRDAAALLNVSLGQVKKAKVVLDHAPPEQIEAVERGETKVGEAYNAITDKRREPPEPSGDAVPPASDAERPQIGLLSEINRWIASLAGRDLKVIPLDDRVAAATAFARALGVIQAARADRWKPEPEPRAKVVNVGDTSGHTGRGARFPVERGGIRGELAAALKRPPKPPPADGDVAAFLANGGEIKRMPTAAVGIGTGTICAEDSAAVAAHEEGREAARAAKRFRDYKGSAPLT